MLGERASTKDVATFDEIFRRPRTVSEQQAFVRRTLSTTAVLTAIERLAAAPIIRLFHGPSAKVLKAHF